METKLNQEHTFRRGLDLSGTAHLLKGFSIKEEVAGKLFVYGLQNVESPLQYASIRKVGIENQPQALDTYLTPEGFLVIAHLYRGDDILTPEEQLFLCEVRKENRTRPKMELMVAYHEGLIDEYGSYVIHNDDNQALNDKQTVQPTIDCLMDKYYFIVDTLRIRERLGEELQKRGNKYARLVWEF